MIALQLKSSILSRAAASTSALQLRRKLVNINLFIIYALDNGHVLAPVPFLKANLDALLLFLDGFADTNILR